MDDYYTHSISITLTERYPHGKQAEQAAVTLHGDGGLEWYVDAFRTALVLREVAREYAEMQREAGVFRGRMEVARG